MQYNSSIMGSTISKPLTNRERAFVRSLANGNSVTRAALDAGYSAKNPGQSGWQALANIRHKVPELLNQHGLTDQALIEKHLKPLLNATEVKHFQHNGEVTDSRRVPDNATRLKALDMAFRLHGSYASRTKEEAEKKAVQVIVADQPRPQIRLPNSSETADTGKGRTS
jgi:hypothetical protein